MESKSGEKLAEEYATSETLKAIGLPRADRFTVKKYPAWYYRRDAFKEGFDAALKLVEEWLEKQQANNTIGPFLEIVTIDSVLEFFEELRK